MLNKIEDSKINKYRLMRYPTYILFILKEPRLIESEYKRIYKEKNTVAEGFSDIIRSPLRYLDTNPYYSPREDIIITNIDTFT